MFMRKIMQNNDNDMQEILLQINKVPPWFKDINSKPSDTTSNFLSIRCNFQLPIYQLPLPTSYLSVVKAFMDVDFNSLGSSLGFC